MNGGGARAVEVGLEAAALAAVLCLRVEALRAVAVSLRVGAALVVAAEATGAVAVDYWRHRKPQ